MIINGGLSPPSFQLVPPSPRCAPRRVRLRRVLRVDATHLGTRSGESCLGTAPNYVWLSRDPASTLVPSHKRARTTHSFTAPAPVGKMQSIEFKGLVRRPPHLVAKGRRIDVWRAGYVKQSLIVRPRRCRCYWYPTRRLSVSETATSPWPPTELRGRTGKDGHWEELRQVEGGCRTRSIMARMLSATMGSSMHAGLRRGTLCRGRSRDECRLARFWLLRHTKGDKVIFHETPRCAVAHVARLQDTTRLPTLKASSDTTRGSSDGSLRACDDQDLTTLQARGPLQCRSLKVIDRVQH